MVSVADFDEILDRLSQFGASGRQQRTGSQERINEDLAREISELNRAVRLLMRHSRQGPDWEASFRVPASGTCGDLTTPFQTTLVHELGYAPDRWVSVRITHGLATTTQPTGVGGLRLISVDQHRVVFQADQAAVNNKAVFLVIPYRQGFVPLGAGSA